MPREKEELCVIDVLRETWKTLNNSKNLEDAKARFRKLVLKLILSEENNLRAKKF